MRRLILTLFSGIGFGLSIISAASATGVQTLSVNDAVAEAVAHNPSIREARENVDVAREAVKSARADLLPQVSAGCGYVGLKEKPILKTDAGDLQVAHQELYSWDVTVVQPLFAGFALRAQLDIAGLDTVSRQLEKEQVTLDIARYVHSACYQLLLARKLLAVSDNEVETLTAHRRNARLFYAQGLIPPNDQLKADVALANAIQDREKVRANVSKAMTRINRLMGWPLDTRIMIRDPDALSTGPAGFNPEVLSRQALQERPIMKLLDVGMEKLGFSVKAAQSAWYPHVSIVGSYAHSGDNAVADENDFTDSDESYAAVQLEWKLWRSGKTRAEVARGRRQMKSLEARIEGYRARVLEEVRNALLDCRVAFSNIDTAEKALDQARENWRITDVQYRQQAATSTDVLDARAYLSQADTNYYQSVYGYLDAVAGLDRAVGAGWRTED